ncbi:class I SAM-dependent methyltransferase [Roseovarius phycicola]|uniref:Class I SAM-dependent methyltransferase n=1 Tax=Roseovarius phycicola TaxID=3080976 RepID=A0ABZ2HGN4_9RHOB
MSKIANTDQAEYWSGPSGEKWVQKQDMFDALMTPVLEVLLARAGIKAGQKVLDIGCGTGASLLQLAGFVGPSGHVTGVDVSTPMLAMARARVETAELDNVTCIEADAQVYDFGSMAVDQIVSRFGVMFFEDPYAAFANIAKALAPGGKMTFITWAGLPENPWFRLPIEFAKARVGSPPPPDPRAPGPMAFSEQDYVTDILIQAGFRDVTAETVHPSLSPLGTLSDVADFAGREGPASRIVNDMGGSDDDVLAIVSDLENAMRDFDTSDGVRVPAKLNLFSGSAAD